MAYKLTEIYDPKVSAELEKHVEEILRLLGEDVGREGLLKTPERVSRAMQFLTQGYEQDGVAIIRSALFDAPDNEVVLVKDIELHSLCEHHLLPFSGKAHVAYIPDKKITGLSKIARMVDCFARRLQVQERLTVQIRDCMEEALHPLGVAVVVEASHSCMTMRGACKSGALTTTSAFSGAFLKDHRTRNEFLNLIK
ncbi:MAG: GTP cyclohydrolase I FolE [Bacteroidales bacterium]|nr:GTP cyclohydrolase I FolE [Bacteroidales bacterium]